MAVLHPDAVGGHSEQGQLEREVLLVKLLEEPDVHARRGPNPETLFPARFCFSNSIIGIMAIRMTTEKAHARAASKRPSKHAS